MSMSFDIIAKPWICSLVLVTYNSAAAARNPILLVTVASLDWILKARGEITIPSSDSRLRCMRFGPAFLEKRLARNITVLLDIAPTLA